MESEQVKNLKLEVEELRKAFMAVIQELKKMRADFDNGLKACQKAFLLCKDGYEQCAEAYMDVDNTMSENFQ